jgi:hypothetical protein
MAFAMDPRLAPFLRIAEVEDGDKLAAALFTRKFGAPPPEFGHHLLCTYLRDDGTRAVASYLHLWKQGTIGLVGGGCTDGNVLRSMSAAQRSAVTDAGGLLFHMLGFCFARFEEGLEAYFGHCGDARAKAVDLAAGFRETADPRLLIRPVGDLSPARASELLVQAKAIGSF